MPAQNEPQVQPAWEGPLFIVGMPRSGTKLLRGLLNRHPRVRIPSFETEFLPFLVRWVETRGRPDDERSFARLHAELSRAPYFVYRNARIGPLPVSEWRSWCAGRFDAAGLFEGIVRYETHIPHGSGVIWGDKSPGYVTHLDMIRQHFPQSRVVHLVRDVRDYCASIRKAWNKDVRRAAHRWGQDVLSAHRHCVADRTHCVEVRYEDLLQSPGQALERVCAFLEIPFTDALTQLEQSVENIGDAKGKTEIVRDNRNKYRTALSRRELESVESLGWTAMRELGYEPQLARGQTHLGSVSLALRRFKDGLRLVTAGAAKSRLFDTLRFHVQHQRMSKP
ncbi:MAG TPA: sulfotransferase [Steroidobacteraceae bacterium]|nr:sulfotransferase [Steroidobacteraceae bacterium]